MKRIPRSHPLHNFCVIVASAIFVAAQTCLAFVPNEWRNTQALDIPAAGLVHVNLPATTLDAAQPGLEDLRIVDPKGDQVPYLIERLLPDAESKMRPAEFRSAIENGATHLSLKTGTRAPIVGVSLETPATRLMKAVDVEGSNDGTTWTKLAGGDSLFQLPNGATKLRVSLPEGAWEFLRVTIDDLGSPPVPFTGAQLDKARATAPAEAVPITIKTRNESPGTTRLALDLGAANLTLGSLRIESNEPAQYSLLSGNTQCAAPRYDLSAMSGKLRNATATDVVPLALVSNPNYRPPEALDALTLTGAQLDVSKWKFRKLLPLTQSSVQQVELDPELLARSQPDQRDIRIVRGEYQLPFLFERTSLSRPISLNAAAAND